MNWAKQGGAGPAGYQQLLVPAMFAPFAELLADAAAIGRGERVLDVACGTGALARAAARRAGPAGAVTGVDLGEPMLEVARAQPRDGGAAPIEYLQSAAEELALGDARFDAVVCQQGLQFFADRGAGLRAMRAAARPGARVAVSTWTALEIATGLKVIADALAEHLGEDVGAVMRSPFSLSDPEELARLLEDAGFERVELLEHELTVRFPDSGGYARGALTAGPVGLLFAEAPAELQQRVLDDVEAGLRESSDGEAISFPQRTNVAIALR